MAAQNTGEWFGKYGALFGDPKSTEQGWEKGGTAAPLNYLYWRQGLTPSGGSDGSYMPVPMTSKEPEWAEKESETLRTAQLGKEFGEKSESMMDYLGAVARGERSAALEQGNIAAAQAAGAAQGRLKAGPWSTAAQRGAGFAAGTAQMEIGAQAQAAALQEKQDAQRAYMAAVEAQRRQDVSAELALEELARRYREMGMNDDQARAAAMRQYAKDLISRYGIQAQGKAMWDEANASSSAAIGQMIGTGLGALAGGLVGGPAGAMAGGSLGGAAGGAIGKSAG